MPLILGPQLTDDQRRQVKAVFVHRLTHEWAAVSGQCPNCREPWSVCLGRCCKAWLVTDEEWIATRAFHFTRKGALSLHRPCYTLGEYAAKGGRQRIGATQDHRYLASRHKDNCCATCGATQQEHRA